MYDLTVEALIAALSGATLVLFGVLLWALGATQRGGRWFAAFAIIWGLALVAGNLARMAADGATLVDALRVFMALQIPVYLPLVMFLARYPRAPEGWLGRPWAFWVLASPAAVLEVILLVDPGLFVSLGTGPDGAQVATVGPLFGPVVNGTGGLLFVLAIVVLGIRALGERGDVSRRQMAVFVTGFALFVSYQAGRALQLVFPGPSETAIRFTAAELLVIVLITTLGTLALIWVLARVRPALPDPWNGLVVWACSVPLAVALAELVLAHNTRLDLETLGLWRLLMVGLFVYALARYRLFDVELRLGSYLPVGVVIVASIVVFEVAWDLVGPSFADRPLLAVGVTVAIEVGLAVVPGLIVRALLNRVRSEEAAYIDTRKREVYQAALEGAWQDQRISSTEARFLADLRHKLGISEGEHRSMLGALGG